MVEKIKDVRSPHGLERLAWRAPIWFYRFGLGGLLGQTFLLLNHVGRKTGQIRQAVLEVVRYDQERGIFCVASGFGEKADWYKNVIFHPEVTIQVGRKCISVRAERLGIAEATEIMLDYNRRNPKLLRALALILGYRTDGSEGDVRYLSGVIPILTFIPLEIEKPRDR